MFVTNSDGITGFGTVKLKRETLNLSKWLMEASYLSMKWMSKTGSKNKRRQSLNINKKEK